MGGDAATLSDDRGGRGAKTCLFQYIAQHRLDAGAHSAALSTHDGELMHRMRLDRAIDHPQVQGKTSMGLRTPDCSPQRHRGTEVIEWQAPCRSVRWP